MIPRSPSHNSSSSHQQTVQSVTINQTSSNDSSALPRQGLNYKDITQSQFLSDSMLFNSQFVSNQTPSSNFQRQSLLYQGTSNQKSKVQEISQMFMLYYGNNQGIVPREKLFQLLGSAYHKSIQNPPLSNENAQELFAIYDQNRDKRITIQDIMSLASRYLGVEPKKIIYTKAVQEKLDVARRLFKMFDVEKRGYLTDKEVPNLLNKTYETLGKSYIASNEDIQSWMHITDDDGDGKVRLEEYEASIIRSMKKMGVKIYDDPISQKM